MLAVGLLLIPQQIIHCLLWLPIFGCEFCDGVVVLGSMLITPVPLAEVAGILLADMRPLFRRPEVSALGCNKLWLQSSSELSSAKNVL